MLSYTHLLIGTPTSDQSQLAVYANTHSVLAAVPAFNRIVLVKGSFPPVQLHFIEKVHILKKHS